MFVEPEKPATRSRCRTPTRCSRTSTRKAKKPDQVAIFTRDGCQFCAKAKALLTELGYDYAEIPLPHTRRSRIVGAVTGEQTVPQVFVNGRHIGGLEALERWSRKAA